MGLNVVGLYTEQVFVVGCLYGGVNENDPFSDIQFFGGEESKWSEITNPFSLSPRRMHRQWKASVKLRLQAISRI